MEPLIARAFLTLILDRPQIAELRALERNLPAGRYLQGFEICRHFRLKPDPITDSREQLMMQLLWDWRKENAISSREDTINDWMDYVLTKWTEPLPMVGAGRASEQFK